MSDALVTELQLKTTGTVEAARSFNVVADSSRTMTRQVEGGGNQFMHLSRAMGHMGGAGRETFMVMRGISEAIETAEGSWSKFGSAIGNTAIFAGAVIVIAKVIEAANQMSEETDKIWEEAGLKAQGFWRNLGIGYGLVNAPKIEVSIDFVSAGVEKVKNDIKEIREMAKGYTHKTDAVDLAAKEITERRATVEPQIVELKNKRKIFSDGSATLEKMDVGELSKEYLRATGKHSGIMGGEEMKAAIKDTWRPAQFEIEKQISVLNKRGSFDAIGKEDLLQRSELDVKQRAADLSELRGSPDKALQLTIDAARFNHPKSEEGFDKLHAAMQGAVASQKEEDQELIEFEKETARIAREDQHQAAEEEAKEREELAAGARELLHDKWRRQDMEARGLESAMQHPFAGAATQGTVEDYRARINTSFQGSELGKDTQQQIKSLQNIEARNKEMRDLLSQIKEGKLTVLSM